MRLKDLEGNIQPFEKEFICAGCRNSIIGLYRKLIDLGANAQAVDKKVLENEHDVVILCKNSGTSTKKFAEVRLLTRSWWNYYHNAKYKRSKPIYKTYNLPRQWKIVLEELIKLKEIPVYEANSMD